MLIFLKFSMWSDVFLIWIKHMVNSILLFLYHQVQETLNGENNLSQLEHYVYRIDTSLYKDFKINKNCFKDPHIYKLGCEMRDTCDEIHRKQYTQLKKIFIPWCLESHNRYYFNISRMITLCYHFYVDNEIYAMEYKKIIAWMTIYSYKIPWVSGKPWYCNHG